MKMTASDAAVNGALHDSAELIRQWALGTDACAQWTAALLDAQAAWWKDMERGTAGLMAPWVDASGAPPSAQPLMDVAQMLSGTALMDAMQQSWNAWGQVWMNALRHDVPAEPSRPA